MSQPEPSKLDKCMRGILKEIVAAKAMYLHRYGSEATHLSCSNQFLHALRYWAKHQSGFVEEAHRYIVGDFYNGLEIQVPDMIESGTLELHKLNSDSPRLVINYNPLLLWTLLEDPLEDSLEFPLEDPDPINHPIHYNAHPSGIECIQITEHLTYCLGNAIKYIWRAGIKDPDAIKDLKKAIWYIEREIQRLQGI